LPLIGEIYTHCDKHLTSCSISGTVISPHTFDIPLSSHEIRHFQQLASRFLLPSPWYDRARIPLRPRSRP